MELVLANTDLIYVPVDFNQSANRLLTLTKVSDLSHKTQKNFALVHFVVRRITEVTFCVGWVQLCWLNRKRLHWVTLDLARPAPEYLRLPVDERWVLSSLILDENFRSYQLTLC